MKPSKLAASLAVVLSAVPFASFAQEAEEASSPFTWSVSAVSDYVWGGVSQTDEDPTAQAGLTYSHDSGFYAGVWGSGVDFGPGDPMFAHKQDEHVPIEHIERCERTLKDWLA